MRRTRVVLLLWLASGCGSAANKAEAPGDAAEAGTSINEEATAQATVPPPPPPPPQDRGTAEPATPTEPMTITLRVADPKLKVSTAAPKQKDKKKTEDAGVLESEEDEAKDDDRPSAAIGLAASAEGQGSLRRDQVEAVLSRHRADFRPCLKQDAVVRIDATITTSGAVADATSERSTPDDTKLRECVTKVFSKLVFPTDWARPGGLEGTHLSLDLRLTKDEEG